LGFPHNCDHWGVRFRRPRVIPQKVRPGSVPTVRRRGKATGGNCRRLVFRFCPRASAGGTSAESFIGGGLEVRLVRSRLCDGPCPPAPDPPAHLAVSPCWGAPWRRPPASGFSLGPTPVSRRLLMSRRKHPHTNRAGLRGYALPCWFWAGRQGRAGNGGAAVVV